MILNDSTDDALPKIRSALIDGSLAPGKPDAPVGT